MSNDLKELQARIAPKLAEYGVVKAGVFGSRARGDAGAGSDLDLLVEFEAGRSLLDLVGLEQDLSELLGTPTEVVTYRSLHPLLRERVLGDEVRLL